MHRSFLALALAAYLPSTRFHCNPRAISLPFEGWRLDEHVGVRGVSVGIGSPQQNFSLVLCAAHVNTYLYDLNASCGAGRTPHACYSSRGGVYNSSLSSSAKAGSPFYRLGFTDDSVKYINDLVVFNDQATSRIEAYDFGVVDKQIYESRLQGFIGVNNDSSLIQALQRANAVSSRSYSFFWGGEIMDESRNGLVTFGGYDESIIKGEEKVTKSFDRTESACVEGMIVELTDMRLFNEVGAAANIFDGQMVNVFDGLGPMKACVVPSMRNIVALPKAYGDRIIRGMGARRADGMINGKFNGTLANTAVVTPESATFKGHLSITIEDNLTVNFTAEQLLLEETYFDSDGLIQRNTSLRNIPLVIEEPPLMPRLGGMFFSSAYLVVNHDQETFVITPADTTKNQPSLVGIDTKNHCFARSNSTKEIDTPDISGKLTAGCIAGITSGTFVLILVTLVTSFINRRRLRPETNETAPVKDAPDIVEASTVTGRHELSANGRLRVTELDGHPQHVPFY